MQGQAHTTKRDSTMQGLYAYKDSMTGEVYFRAADHTPDHMELQDAVEREIDPAQLSGVNDDTYGRKIGSVEFNRHNAAEVNIDSVVLNEAGW